MTDPKLTDIITTNSNPEEIFELLELLGTVKDFALSNLLR